MEQKITTYKGESGEHINGKLNAAMDELGESWKAIQISTAHNTVGTTVVTVLWERR